MRCPNCKAPRIGIFGGGYRCGSFYTWSGLKKTNECTRVGELIKNREVK